MSFIIVPMRHFDFNSSFVCSLITTVVQLGVEPLIGKCPEIQRFVMC